MTDEFKLGTIIKKGQYRYKITKTASRMTISNNKRYSVIYLKALDSKENRVAILRKGKLEFIKKSNWINSGEHYETWS